MAQHLRPEAAAAPRRQSRMLSNNDYNNRVSYMMPANRRNRQTMWPSPFNQQQDEELAMPGWPGQRNTQRWTNTFDSEARAARMSLYVADSLLPQAPRAPDQWAGQNRRSQYQRRATWMNQIMSNNDEDAQPIWEGNFDVEKRKSFATRTSGMSESSWYEDEQDMEKFEASKPRDPLTAEQLAQADPAGGLVTADVLTYPFPGEGTAEDPYMISWIDNDPANPLNFTKGKKWLNALILAMAVWTVSIASSGFSQGESLLLFP